MTRRPRCALAMAAYLPARLFTPADRARMEALGEVEPVVLTDFDAPGARRVLAEVDVLVTGWESPYIDAAVLDRAPRLRAVLHTAGTVKHHVHPVCFERGLAVTSAAGANALPVAEYTLAWILLAGKGVMALKERYARERTAVPLHREYPEIGNAGRHVGIIGASRIGRRVIELLRPHDVLVSVHDPYLDAAGAKALGVRTLPLDELLEQCSVVSVHAPLTDRTRGMLDRRRLGLLRDGSTLLNTARGALIDQRALTEELVAGRLHAVLDVTDPEVLPADSPLYELPNVVLTPHLAGSSGNELTRLGRAAVDELERFVHGRPFRAPVAGPDLDRTA
ncbi:hydroxyacid dehydrogenase [Streptomyces sp. NPDC060194]|uniref:hydroxyacid dehydrogenase n=1 Tax=Streptomyces sp. NPDC060194 TaxID=3347069 RepID=UPI00364AF070